MLKPVHDGFDVDSGRAAAHDAKHVYSRLLEDPTTAADAARDYLTDRLAAAERLPSELPDDPRQLAVWSQMGSESVGRQYRRYLNARRGGEGRRIFGCKAHALYFLNRVAPTKLVDGAWLAGLLPYWNDSRFYFLLRTYLEELGDGVPEKNHVVLYRRLIAGYGCENLDALPDDCFVQGAIQLALGRLGTEFLPEVIGYNLGYEQLPLHLLVTAYELDELGIDPYYFTLHVTVDNAASGHAQKAVRALLELLPDAADREDFYRRVVAGYKLNELGAGSMAAIESFELEREVVRVLAAKAGIGAQLHSDYCRIGGKTVSEWLSEPLQISAFLTCLQQSGWIRRNEDPRLSRFWQLIDGERAAMFGVFTPYERQLVHDWIAGTASLPRLPSHRARLRRQRLEQTAPASLAAAPADADSRALREELAALTRPPPWLPWPPGWSRRCTIPRWGWRRRKGSRSCSAEAVMPTDTSMGRDALALLELSQALRRRGYRFTTVTPATHARVNARDGNQWADDLEGVFGWSRPFRAGLLPADLIEPMEAADVLQAEPDGWRSRVRFSTLGDRLFVHSAYPTVSADAVFFGPDSYRFVAAIDDLLERRDRPVRRAVDIGCGAGPGAVTIAGVYPEAEVLAADVNDLALAFTAVNAVAAGVSNVATVYSDLLRQVGGEFDLIVANPPYMLDPAERAYRHGGGEHGEGLSLAIVDAALDRLAAGGVLLLYTGVAVVAGKDPLRAASARRLSDGRLRWDYRELDPDVFGEELERAPYRDVDRIAVVRLLVQRPAGA